MLLLALVGALAQTPSPADTTRLVVVATADVHGRLTGWDNLGDTAAAGGLTRVATIVDSLRRRYPDATVLLDAGDALQGDPLGAYFARVAPRDLHPVVDAMNTLGYDAVTPGNHDFDFGADVFDRALVGSTFPWVSANLVRPAGDSLLLRPFVVIVRNGVRVAVGGFTTPALMVGNRERLRSRLRASPIEPLVEPLVRAMRREADLVVLLSHSGLGGAAAFDTTGLGSEHAGRSLAAARVRPDLVVLGHSHHSLADSLIQGVHFVQPPPGATGVSVVHVTLARREGRLAPVSIQAELLPLDGVGEEPRLSRRLSAPQAAVRHWLATRIGEADSGFSLAAARVEDTPLMRFIQSVQREATGADLSASPVPDRRAGLRAGEITRRDVFALYPGEQTLLSVRISGTDLKAYLERSARYFYADSTGLVAVNRYVAPANYDLVGGAGYTIDLSRPAGDRVTRLEVDGRPVAAADSLTLALPNDRQEGRGSFPAVATAPVARHTETAIRDLLLAAIARRGRLRLEDHSGRGWALVPPDMARRARELFVVPSPVATVTGPPSPPPSADSAHRDSLERTQSRVHSAARTPVATLRLPAPQGGGDLARLLADAYRNELRVDLAIVPLASGDAGLPAGPVTAGTVRSAVSAEPGIVVITVPGGGLRALLEELVADSAPCCEVSGADIQFDPARRPLDRLKSLDLATGALDGRRRYTVALSGTLLAGDSTLRLRRGACREAPACAPGRRVTDFAPSRPERSPVELVASYLSRLRQPVSPPASPRVRAAP